jgi:5-methyltetrahydropteroyltriglutamate--homocysteine methyltransferase
MVLATNLGFPRVGVDRELKKALEAYWKGKGSREELLKTAADLRLRHWKMQKDAGIEHIPSNDFSLYDHVLDTACLLGCVPERYGDKNDLDRYFAMARGDAKNPAMEMTKWFDTNYHYIVPEIEEGQKFKLSGTKIFDEFAEAKKAGITTRPVLVGPITFLRLGKKRTDADFCRCTLVESISAVYGEILKKLEEMGAEWVQIDEPYLIQDMPQRYRDAYITAFRIMREAAPGIKIMLATYFESLEANMELAFRLPVQAVHLDLVRAPNQIRDAVSFVPEGMMLSLGVVDGRNIWRNDLHKSLEFVEFMESHIGKDKIMVAPSCSLLHTPIDLDREEKLNPTIRDWMAFAKQKLEEIAVIAKEANEGYDSVAKEMEESDAVVADRKTSTRIHNPDVKKRAASVTPAMINRKSPFPARQKAQQAALKLPPYPTTTIGSFPQTVEIRKARADFKKGAINAAEYEAAMKKEIAHVVQFQEKIDMDVPVHGEAERNDMVEYFGEQLAGFAFTQNGWVQSYGSRCVKPPIIFGDVSRPMPMTVKWSTYAQSLTKRPMKGMLTGPITILQWSFVRDDQPRSETCKQIALALRDEVADLEKAGITVIQMDEPAIREGLPLRKEDWAAYLKWAVDCFKLSVCTVADTTQIHTHMCYSDFNDIIESVGALDADVISIETSRSQMELLDAFAKYKYPNEIGPGVYDIHSPRVPTVQEMTALLEKAAKVIDPSLLWVNPDCGLKTRGWPETETALKNMIEAAKAMRQNAKSAAA